MFNLKTHFKLQIITIVQFSILLLTNNSFGQQPNYDWVKGFNGHFHGYTTAISADDFGNLYVGGFFSDTAHFDNYTLIDTSSIQHNDAYVVKIDSSGNVLWAFQITGNGNEGVTAIDTDNASNIYVTGYYHYEAYVGSIYLPHTGDNEDDFFVAKLDSSGNLLWAISEGGLNTDEPFGLAVDESGNPIVVGRFIGSKQIGNDFLNNQGMYDIFIAKYSTDGIPIWSKSAGGAWSDHGYGIDTDSNENIYVTGGYGSYGNEAYFGNDTLTPVSGLDAYITKLDPNGNFLWVRSGGGDGNSSGGWGDRAFSVSVAGDAVYTTGSFWDTAFFDNDTIISNGMGESFIAKYDLSGNLDWAIGDGGIKGDQSHAVAADEYGGVYATGYFYDTGYYGDSALVNPTLGAYMFVVKYDSSGQFQWAKKAGFPHGANGTKGLAIDTYQDHVYLGGFFQDSAEFDGSIIYSHQNMSLNGYAASINQHFDFSSIEPITKSYDFKLFPNPTNSGFKINIQAELLEKVESIIVTNEKGQIVRVFSDQFNSTPLVFDNLDLKRGMYFVSIISKEFVSTEKLVVY